jgi:hypothetical protein
MDKEQKQITEPIFVKLNSGIVESVQDVFGRELCATVCDYDIDGCEDNELVIDGDGKQYYPYNV